MMKTTTILLKKKISNLTKLRTTYIFLLLGTSHLHKKIHLLVAILTWNCTVFGICMSHDRMLKRSHRLKNTTDNGGCIPLPN